MPSQELAGLCYNQFLFTILRINTTLQNSRLPRINLTSEQVTDGSVNTLRSDTWFSVNTVSEKRRFCYDNLR